MMQPPRESNNSAGGGARRRRNVNISGDVQGCVAAGSGAGNRAHQSPNLLVSMAIVEK